MAPFVILTGASGAGKTAIADVVAGGRCGLVDVFFFDRIGVPSRDEMVAGWGSDEAWQRAMTADWITRIANSPGANRPTLFEGQMRPSFIRDALDGVEAVGARIVLVDCDDETRARRLRTLRKQPELVTPAMLNWASFLRRDAQANGCEVLDTSNLSLRLSVARVCALLREPGHGDA